VALDLEEQEQVDELKAWWNRYGNLVLLGLTAFLLAVAGIQGWRYYQTKQATAAAEMFGTMQTAMVANDLKRMRDLTGTILDQYPGTAYAVNAALISARANYETGDTKSAKAQLQWVMDHAKQEAPKQMARLRLAGILLDEKNYAEAMKLLEVAPDEAFSGLYADLKGDVLAAQGKVQEASAAYKVALSKGKPDSAYHKLVQIKLDTLGAGK
jgi:predicted negative regulator of RcsB-dependent stress response